MRSSISIGRPPSLPPLSGPRIMPPSSQGEAQASWAEAVVPIRLGEGDSRLLALGRRQGGRRYMSEDLDTLAKAASEIVARVESLRRQEMNRLVSQAELRALRSQINPHFLFNALNALYGAIPREAAAARRMVLNLAEIFATRCSRTRPWCRWRRRCRSCTPTWSWNSAAWPAGSTFR